MQEITQTNLSDREIALHALSHLEALHDRIEQIWAVLEPLLPFAARFAGGQANVLDAMQARRELRRGLRGTHNGG